MTPAETHTPRPNGYTLISPQDEDDWRAYHDIRRTVLFDPRGVSYDEHHPDEQAPGHHPKLLTYREEAIGAIRIDVAGAEAFFRRVAIRPDMQRAGHGRLLLSLAEQFAREHGCEIAESYVAPDAVEFYRKCGFLVRQEAVVGPSGRTAVLMSKRLR